MATDCIRSYTDLAPSNDRIRQQLVTTLSGYVPKNDYVGIIPTSSPTDSITTSGLQSSTAHFLPLDTQAVFIKPGMSPSSCAQGFLNPVISTTASAPILNNVLFGSNSKSMSTVETFSPIIPGRTSKPFERDSSNSSE